MNLTRPFSLLVACLALGCTKREMPAPAKEHRAILYFDGDGRFQMDYEGTGLLQLSSTRDDALVFKAMHLEHWTEKDFLNEKWVDSSFEGKLTQSGDDVRIDLKIKNKVKFEIRVLGISPKGSQASAPLLIEHTYSPGDHELVVEGAVVERYEKQ
jgi:hypothetical protein